jgi:hypothetical protein
VEVDLTGVEAAGKLEAGTTVTVRPAQNLEQSVERVFDGSPVEIPMTGWTAAAPHGRDLAQEPLPEAFPEFGAFVLDWPMAGPVQPDSAPLVIEDPGRGLSGEEARNTRDAAWRTSNPDERDRQRLDRLHAWRVRTLGRGE